MELRQDPMESKQDFVRRHEERIRQWRKTPGDLDDFIFTFAHQTAKEQSER